MVFLLLVVETLFTEITTLALTENAEYQKGVKDGCKTSDGNYAKNHTLFNAMKMTIV